jgi:hypothetical protein
MNASLSHQTLRVMPREMRMMSERIFSLTGQPKGFFYAVQDVVMYSQKLGLGGFALLEQRFDLLCTAHPERISIRREEAGVLDLDGGGQHAWFVLPAVVDLLGELVARFGAAELTVDNVVDAGELKIAEDLARRTGLAVTFEAGTKALITAVPKPLTGDVRVDEPLLWNVLENGVGIDAELWWRIYHWAKKALAPDSIVSRRHAGPMIVNQDGTVIGRKDNDDETDFSFLMSPRPTKSPTESTSS